ncbi:MAG: acetolactate synthase small subunit [Planctomycetaceae bacterium]|mgnify:CR=1 FL=1|nr:acetolactate synthase small subunit [Planctomycetaceae bacterium]
MSTRTPETPASASPSSPYTVLEMTVRNHPGVMSHICGLFARRAFNMDAILCMPIGEGSTSRIWLRVREDRRLEQLIRQTLKLVDVLDVRRHDAEHEVFLRLEQFFTNV